MRQVRRSSRKTATSCYQRSRWLTILYNVLEFVISLHNLIHLIQVFDLAVRNLHPNPSDICSVFVNMIAIAAFIDNATHYNSSAQPHMLTKIFKAWSGAPNQSIVVC